MHNLQLICIVLFTIGSIAQARVSNDISEQHQEHTGQLAAIVHKFENLDLYKKVKNVVRGAEDKISFLKNLPKVCSAAGEKEASQIIARVDNEFDYCANLSVQLQNLKKLAINGTAILADIGLHVSDIVAELTVCSLKPIYLQIGCVLKVVLKIDKTIKEVSLETHEWSVETTNAVNLAYIDFQYCYRHHNTMEQRLEAIVKAAMACTKEFK